MKRFFLVYFLLTSILFISGCWDSDELEEMLYIHSIGLDYQEGRYYVYAQVFNFESLPTGAESGGEVTQTTVGLGEGVTVVDAVHDLYSTTQRKIFWGHLSSVVFSENVLFNDIDGALDVISRYSEIRPTPWIFATDENFRDLLNTLPTLGVNIIYSFFGEPLESYNQSSIVKPFKYNRFVAERGGPGRTVILPVLDVDESSWFDKQGVKTNLNISSVALLSDEKFYGFLHEEDANGIRWYQKDTLRAPIVIDNEEGEVKGLIVLRVRDTNVKPVVSNEAVKFKIDVKVAGSLIEMSQETTEKEIIKSVKEKIKEDLRRTYEKGLELDGDVYSFSYHLFRENPNKWKQLTVNEALHLNEDSLEDINVEVYLRDAGEKRLSQ